jgi:hypothetical protein
MGSTCVEQRGREPSDAREAQTSFTEIRGLTPSGSPGFFCGDVVRVEDAWFFGARSDGYSPIAGIPD